MVVENLKVVKATYELYIAGEDGKEELMEKATAEAEEGVMELPKTMFFNGDGEFDEERVYVGAIVPMNTVDGQIVKAQVCEITDDKVTIDLNHPYAGEDLHFKGEILEIRDVTEGELKAIRNPRKGCCGGGCSKKKGGDCGDCSDGSCGSCEGCGDN